MLILLQGGPKKKKKISKPWKISQSWIVFLWQCKHTSPGHRNAPQPRRNAGLCLSLPHPAPRTLWEFEAMALISRKLALLYKQILKNSIAMTCCSLPDTCSCQEQLHFSAIFPHIGEVAWTDISLHCDTRYVPESGSNSLDLEQPHLPKGSLTRRFLPHAGLWLSYLKFSILASVASRGSQRPDTNVAM